MWESPALLGSVRLSDGSLLTDAEYLHAAGRADAMGCQFLVPHDDALGVLDLFFGAALHAVRLHQNLLSPNEMVGYSTARCQLLPEFRERARSY